MKSLREYLPVSCYGKGKAKSFEALEEEVRLGECRIIWADSGPIREVSVVRVKVLAHPKFLENAVLYEVEQIFADGRIRRRGIESLSEKLNPGEEPIDCAVRAIAEELKIHNPVTLICGAAEEERCDSPSYPGLLTQYQIHHFIAYLPLEACKHEYRESTSEKTTVFRWR